MPTRANEYLMSTDLSTDLSTDFHFWGELDKDLRQTILNHIPRTVVEERVIHRKLPASLTPPTGIAIGMDGVELWHLMPDVPILETLRFERPRLTPLTFDANYHELTVTFSHSVDRAWDGFEGAEIEALFDAWDEDDDASWRDYGDTFVAAVRAQMAFTKRWRGVRKIRIRPVEYLWGYGAEAWMEDGRIDPDYRLFSEHVYVARHTYIFEIVRTGPDGEDEVERVDEASHNQPLVEISRADRAALTRRLTELGMRHTREGGVDEFSL